MHIFFQFQVCAHWLTKKKSKRFHRKKGIDPSVMLSSHTDNIECTYLKSIFEFSPWDFSCVSATPFSREKISILWVTLMIHKKVFISSGIIPFTSCYSRIDDNRCNQLGTKQTKMTFCRLAFVPQISS